MEKWDFGDDVDELDELEKQLAGMEDEEMFDIGDDLEDEIRRLEEQLENDDDLEQEEVAEGYPTHQAVSTILVIDTILDQYQSARKSKEAQFDMKHHKGQDVEDVKLQKQTQVILLTKYFSSILNKKKAMVKDIKEGRLTSQHYVGALNQTDTKEIVNDFRRKETEKEKVLMTKFQSPEVFFQKVAGKFQKSLEVHMQSIKEEKEEKTKKQPKPEQKPKQEVKEVKPQEPVKEPVKALSEEEQKQIAIGKMDGLPITKKLEFTLKSNFKVESYMEYFIKNLEQSQAKTISKQLLPVMKKCRDLILNLGNGKNEPVGNFLINEVPKMTFQRFHQISKKEYLMAIEAMINQFKGYCKIQDAFCKKCSESAVETEDSPFKRSERLKQHYEQSIAYLNGIKTRQFNPLPKLQVKSVEREAYVQNTGIPKNQLHLRITSINGLQLGCTLKIFIPQVQEQAFYSQFVNPGDQKILTVVQLKDEVWKDLTRLEIIVKFSEKKMFFMNSDLGQVKIITKDLQYKNYIKGTAEGDNKSIRYEMTTRYPRHKTSKALIQEATLKKIPEFSLDSKKETQFIRKYIKNYLPPKQPRLATLFYVERTEDMVKKLQSLKIKGVEQEVIVEPEGHSSSREYIAEMDKVVDRALNGIYSFKENRKILDRAQNTMLEQRISKDKSKYAQGLEFGIERDRKLKSLYEKEGLSRMAEFIACRLNIMIEELQTLVFEIRVQEETRQQAALKAKQQEKKQKQEQIQSVPPPPLSIELTMIAEDPKLALKPLDIRTPWLPEFCRCLTYLEKMIEIATEQKLKDDFTKAKDEFMEGFNSGQIDAETYANNLKNYLQADRSRLSVYLAEQIPEYAKFISARIKIIQEELSNL